MGNCVKEGDLASLKENLKILHKRVDNVENINTTLSTLTTSVAVMAEQMKTTNESLGKLTEDVEFLKDEDADSYKHYKRQISTWIVLFVLGTIAGTFIK